MESFTSLLAALRGAFEVSGSRFANAASTMPSDVFLRPGIEQPLKRTVAYEMPYDGQMRAGRRPMPNVRLGEEL